MGVFHKLIYRIGIQLRNPEIPARLDFLRRSQHWSREKLQKHQATELRRLVHLAYEQSAYYRALFDANNLRPDDIRSLADLEKIPPTSKATLLAQRDRIQGRVAGEKHYHSETSGSTGKPLVFYRNRTWDAWHNASVFRGLEWHGVEPWDRNGYLWGYNLSAKQAALTRYFDHLQNRFRLFSYSDDEIEKFCQKLTRATYLNGYSSMIHEVAKYVERHPELKSKIQLRFIKGTSEKILPSYQQSAKQAFGRGIVSEYGAAEAGIIAFECPEGKMHLNMETAIVEECEGKILVTNLVSDSFPVIRYELGDVIDVDFETCCPCGRKSHILNEVTGRTGSNIHGDKNIYPSLTLYYIFKNIAVNHQLILNYQAEQTSKGQIELRIEQHLSDADKRLINVEIDKYFGRDLHFHLKDGQQLISRTGKTKDFITSLE